MRKKTNGFTLVELLAVVAVLAIIALIAVPITTSIINDAKKTGIETSVKQYISALEQEIYRKRIESSFKPTSCKVKSDGNLSCNTGEITLEMKGIKPTSGIITLSNGIVKSVKDFQINGYSVAMNNEKFYLKSSDGYTKGTYTDSNLGKPDIYNGTLTPVIYNGTNWIVADDSSMEWYNYSEQWWANAVILDSSVRATKKVGDIVTVDGTNPDALAMFVWIPRYEYKVGEKINYKVDDKDVTIGEIQVNFISKEKTTATNGYTIHPAFKFGNTELSGIWIGKFETSHIELSTSTTNDNLCGSATNCIYSNIIESADGLRILPNAISLTRNKAANFFSVSREMGRTGNTFGIVPSLTNSHMTKNSEWVSAAYLSQSIYGKYGNKNYANLTDKIVYRNNSTNEKTECGVRGTTITGKSDGNTISEYGLCAVSYNYNTEEGIGASTTGNIYGVYDMSGGSAEYVMGISINNLIGAENDNKNNSGFHWLSSQIWFDKPTSTPYTIVSPSYYDVIETMNEVGSGLTETENSIKTAWGRKNTTSNTFSNKNNVYALILTRGGNGTYAKPLGVFSYSDGSASGGSSVYTSFRIALTNP